MINKINNRIETLSRPPLAAPNDEKIGRIGEMQKRRAILDLAELLVSWEERALDLEQCHKWLSEFRQLLNFIGGHSVMQERYLAQDGTRCNLGEILEHIARELKTSLDFAKSNRLRIVELKQGGQSLMQDLSMELKERLWRLS